MQEAQNPDFLDFGNFSSNTFGSSLEIFAQHTPIQRHTPTIQQLTHPLGVPLLASRTFVAMSCALCWWWSPNMEFCKNPLTAKFAAGPSVRLSAYLLGTEKHHQNSFHFVLHTCIGASLQILAENTSLCALFKIVRRATVALSTYCRRAPACRYFHFRDVLARRAKVIFETWNLF